MIAQRINRVVRKGDLTKIENYDKAVADKTQTWICHHRLELTLDGEFAHTQEDLIRMGMYYNRPYFELIFVTRAEHNKLHRHNKGKSPSEETRKKLSESRKKWKPSEEHKKKIGLAHRKPVSDFGKKYFDHFGYTRSENRRQYSREINWYLSHNHKCSWEV